MSDYPPQMPPEIAAFVEKAKAFFNKLKGSKAPKGSKGAGVTVIIVLLLIVAAYSGFYTIAPDEAGVVLRFGKYVGTSEPGLHFKVPFGIDKVNKVQLTTIRKEEFGFRTTRAGVVSRYAKGSDFDAESLMLTGDLNVADVEWIVQFKVSDPYKFLFNVRNVKKNLRDVSESVMRLVVGDDSVNEVLTTGRVGIADIVKTKMQETYDLYGMGIIVTNVILQDVNPPDRVKPSFNEVNEAKQEQEKMINQAWEVYNKTIPEEKGKAEQTIAVAEGYASERINKAKGEATRFTAVFNQYLKAPEVTRARIYLETMEDVMKKADKVYIMDPNAKTLLPHFDVKDRMGKGGAK